MVIDSSRLRLAESGKRKSMFGWKLITADSFNAASHQGLSNFIFASLPPQNSLQTHKTSLFQSHIRSNLITCVSEPTALNLVNSTTRRRAVAPAIMAAPSREAARASVDRQTTTPFHLKLFYRVNNFHNLSEYSIPPPPRRGGPASGPNAIRAPSPPPAAATLPAHLEIYTWQSCTLRELSQLLTSALPSLLPDPPVGTRLCFRLIYPDAKGAAIMGPDARGRYISRDLGSVIVGPRDSPYRGEEDSDERAEPRPRSGPLRFQGSEADKALQDARFIVGDYVECAILPPLEDGSVAPPLRGGSGPPPAGGGMRAFRDNGFGRPGRGGPRGGDRGGPPALPPGDWKRGERLPEGGGRGGGRRGWAPY